MAGSDGNITAAELVASIQDISHYLQVSGASTIGLYGDNSPAWAVIDLACQAQGVCLVPIPTFFSTAQIEHLVATAGVQLVFCQQQRRSDLQHLCAEPEAVPGSPSYLGMRPVSVSAAQAPRHSNKITFTSGSTGEPKGVCLSTAQCLNVARSLAGAIGVSGPRHMCVLPLSTLLENIGGIYVPLLTDGCSVILAPGELGMQGSSGIDAQAFLGAISQHQPNTMILVPQLLAVLDGALQAGWQPPVSLQFVAVGGARVAPELLQRVRAAGLPAFEGYGLSECGSVVGLNCPQHDRPGTSGRVLPHVNVHERDGELVVSGNTFLGYLNQPETWGQQEVDTGDIGSIDDDGYITVAGRSKNVLISSFGRNINPEWVESELLAGGLFRQVLVIGDGRPCCAALLLPVDPQLTDAEIQREVDAVGKRLPDYARPGRWLRLQQPFTAANGLLTDNGRPRRAGIIAAYADDIELIYSELKESVLL